MVKLMRLDLKIPIVFIQKSRRMLNNENNFSTNRVKRLLKKQQK